MSAVAATPASARTRAGTVVTRTGLIRIGVVAESTGPRHPLGARARQAAAMAWLAERDVDLVAVHGSAASDDRAALTLTLRTQGQGPGVTLLVGGSPLPTGPLVANAWLATGAPTVVVSGASRGRGSVAAGPVLELGGSAAPCEWAMIELAYAEDGRLWVWREAGRPATPDAEDERILSATMEAWVFDGSRWRLG
jgi:hypothetical protein